MKKISNYLLKYKSIPTYLKWMLGRLRTSIIVEWLTADIKNKINRILGENADIIQDITENEANVILRRIVGNDVI